MARICGLGIAELFEKRNHVAPSLGCCTVSEGHLDRNIVSDINLYTMDIYRSFAWSDPHRQACPAGSHRQWSVTVIELVATDPRPEVWMGWPMISHSKNGNVSNKHE